MIEGINKSICCLVNKMQTLPSLFTNFLQPKENVDLFQRQNMCEIYGQDYLNYDHVNIKVMW